MLRKGLGAGTTDLVSGGAGDDLSWVCPRGHLADFSQGSCSACRYPTADDRNLANRATRHPLSGPFVVAMVVLVLLAIMSVVTTLNLSPETGSTTGGSSDATTPSTPAPAPLSRAEASRAAAYDDGRAYGQSLQRYGDVPEPIACAAAPRDWKPDQAPNWLTGCHDSYSSPRRTVGGTVP